jgi:hypothetical protein
MVPFRETGNLEEWPMTFQAKGFVVLAGFAALVLLATGARSGTLGIGVALVGVIAILLVEILVTPLGDALYHRVVGRG